MQFRKRRCNHKREFFDKTLISLSDLGLRVMIVFVFSIGVLDDKGLTVQLPPHYDESVSGFGCRRRNVCRVVINANNQLLVRGRQVKVEHLREMIKTYIVNPNNDDMMAHNPKTAIISLQNDRGTTYEAYFEVYHEIKAAYKEIWNTEARKRFGYKFKHLDNTRKHEIFSDYPMIISEAEPTQFAKR